MKAALAKVEEEWQERCQNEKALAISSAERLLASERGAMLLEVSKTRVEFENAVEREREIANQARTESAAALQQQDELQVAFLFKDGSVTVFAQDYAVSYSGYLLESMLYHTVYVSSTEKAPYYNFDCGD